MKDDFDLSFSESSEGSLFLGWKHGDKHYIVLRDQPEAHDNEYKGNISTRWMANVVVYDDGAPRAALVDQGKRFWKAIQNVKDELTGSLKSQIIMIKRMGQEKDTSWTVIPADILTEDQVADMGQAEPDRQDPVPDPILTDGLAVPGSRGRGIMTPGCGGILGGCE